jgi:N6-adenosine-specific RNA methylase IME4
MKQVPFPNKKYHIIYADPPWDFGNSGVFQDGRSVRKTCDKYRLTKTKDLMNLKVNEIAEDTSVLLMWTTDQHLPDALQLIESWGFKYSTVAFYWVKKYASGSLCSNIGRWTMKNCEMCLLASKGNAYKLKKTRNIKQLVEAVRTKHSEKPQEVRDRIVSLFGDISRIELFARQKVDGWDAWGDEV